MNLIAQTPEVAVEVAKRIPYEEIGVLGTVILVLAGLIWHLLREASKERKETRDEHREERKEWQESANTQTEKLEQVVVTNHSRLESVATAIKDALVELKHTGN